MDSILPIRAPNVASQYFLGDMPIDSGMFKKLSTIKLMADAGIDDRSLMPLINETLFADPRQTELENMTLRQTALSEARALKELGYEDAANEILQQYGYKIPSPTDNITSTIKDANIGKLETELQGIDTNAPDYETKIRENLLKQKFYQSNQAIPGDMNLGFDKDKGQLYFSPKDIGLGERISAAQDMNPRDMAGNNLLSLIFPGAGILNMYGALGDTASQKRRQYLNL